MPSGVKRRPLLLDGGSNTIGEYFKLLTTKMSHFLALMTVGETYLAMPRSDDNFVSDFQTVNFSSRLWELYWSPRSASAKLRQGGPETMLRALEANPEEYEALRGNSPHRSLVEWVEAAP